MIDPSLLKTFAVVAKTGSMVDAAAELHCTAPAVSQQISRLEARIATRLFDRIPQGVSITAAGESLLPLAGEVLDAVERFELAARSVDGKGGGRLRITAFASAAAFLLPRVLRTLRDQFVDAELSLVEGDWTRPFDVLLLGKADLVVTHEYDHVPLVIPPGVTVVEQFRDPFRVVLPAGHGLASKSAVAMSDLAPEKWVAHPRRYPQTASLIAAAADSGFTPKVTSEVDDYAVLLGMVRAGLGVGVLNQLVLSGVDLQGVVIRNLVKPATGRRVLIATRVGPRSELAAAAADELVSRGRALVRSGR